MAKIPAKIWFRMILFHAACGVVAIVIVASIRLGLALWMAGLGQ
jgi:hypothetical protein